MTTTWDFGDGVTAEGATVTHSFEWDWATWPPPDITVSATKNGVTETIDVAVPTQVVFPPLVINSMEPTTAPAGAGTGLAVFTSSIPDPNFGAVVLVGPSGPLWPANNGTASNPVWATTVPTDLPPGVYPVTVVAIGAPPSDPVDLTITAALFDPAAHTVAEVIDYVDAHPDEADAIEAAERDGKARTTLLAYFDGRRG